MSWAAAATIKEKAGVDGVYLNPGGYFMLPFIYGEGGDLIDATAKKIVVNSAAAVKGAGIPAELLKAPGFTKPRPPTPTARSWTPSRPARSR